MAIDWGVYFRYDEHSGSLIRLSNGRVAGSDNGSGYLRTSVTLSGKQRWFRVHRIIWEMFNGLLAEGEQIDHINHNKKDNRLCNLRKVSQVENHRNQPMISTNKSGVTGVMWHKQRRKWCAFIVLMGKRKHLGLFDVFEDAKAARESANKFYGFHDNHGIRR